MKKAVLFCVSLLVLTLSLAPLALAHEVYVLNQKEIHLSLKAPIPDFIGAIQQNMFEFVTWGVIVLTLILVIFLISTNTYVEKLLDPVLFRLKRWAPHIAQVSLGLALLASGFYSDLFGIELPIATVFGPHDLWMGPVLMVIGGMLVVGILPRIAAIITVIFFALLTIKTGVYTINYFTYLGEAITMILFGGSHSIFTSKKVTAFFHKTISPKLHDYKFLIMRIFFGISLIYASLYAKLFHGVLALDVVAKYNLTDYFPFDPIFLVLGAMLLEVMLGVFFLIGFEIRFASLFFLVFLTMSLFFFGESVWPHIILIGTALAMFTHGYDRFTFQHLISKKRKGLEPTL